MNTESADEITAITIELRNQRPEAGRVEQLGEVVEAGVLGINGRGTQRAERVERRRDHEHDREQREEQATMPTRWRQPTWRNQLPLALPSLHHLRRTGSRDAGVLQVGRGDGCSLISSSPPDTLVRRKLTIEITATITKISIETAAAKP